MAKIISGFKMTKQEIFSESNSQDITTGTRCEILSTLSMETGPKIIKNCDTQDTTPNHTVSLL